MSAFRQAASHLRVDSAPVVFTLHLQARELSIAGLRDRPEGEEPRNCPKQLTYARGSVGVRFRYGAYRTATVRKRTRYHSAAGFGLNAR
jgi:hypothetical protein